MLTNNLEFFAKSKNSDKLRAEVEKKISQAEAEIEKLKKSDYFQARFGILT